MQRLSRLMNDTPTLVKLAGTVWEIHALKPGTQWLIAEEACKILKNENMSMGDVIRQFAVNMPSVARVVTLALLNDKRKIYGAEYALVYDQLMWGEYKLKDWAQLLFEILNLIDVDFFFASTDVIATVRQTTLNRKMTAQEQKSSRPERNGDR